MNSYHHQNLTHGEKPLWRHGRAWWRRMHWEWTVGSWRVIGPGFAVGRYGFHFELPLLRLHVDWTRGSGMGRRWQVYWMDGCLWLQTPWGRDMEWRSSDPWWRKGLCLHVKDWLIGRPKHSVEKEELGEVFIPMPEGSYRATATRERRQWKRRWYWPTLRRDSVWLDIDGGGIPHSGKGENSWDCGDDGLCGIGGDTLEEAIGNAVATALRYRGRYGLDSKGTGGIPVQMVPSDRLPA